MAGLISDIATAATASAPGDLYEQEAGGASKKITALTMLASYATTATAAGTTTLTADSLWTQYFTGVTTQTIALPVVSTLVVGHTYLIVNLSTGALTVNSSGGNLVTTVPAGVIAAVRCILVTGTGAASWHASGVSPVYLLPILDGLIVGTGATPTNARLRNSSGQLDVVLGDLSAFGSIKANKFISGFEWYTNGAGWQSTTLAGAARASISALSYILPNGSFVADTEIVRVAAGVVGPTNGSGTGAWFQNTAGRSRIAADITNATTTFANLTGLSHTVIAGRTYSFKLVVFCANSTAVDGAKFDFDGGTATATNFRQHATLFDTALLASTQTAALATAIAAATVTGDAYFEAHGTITVNAAGTLIPRFAKNSHTTGTLTAYRGSYLWLEDTP